MIPVLRCFGTFHKKSSIILLAAILLACLPLAGIAQYVGAETCSNVGCHDDNYSEWLTSGHRVILMESAAARHRSLPLPEGVTTWDDISFAVGGHKTKALYLDSDGNIIDQQYNLLTGEWTEYTGDSTYDCGECHTTGYDAAGTGPLPGMVGSFELAGVQCEHCHGAGLAMLPGSTDPAFCGECHNHGSTDTVAASGGFIISEGQYNEFLAGPHSNENPLLDNGCVTCHNPHKSAEFGITQECSDCHTTQASSYAGSVMDKAGVDCEDCHMPPATLSAQALGPNTGDMKSHIFYINTNPAGNMFTQDGSAVALTDGKGAVTLDFACQRCHQGASLDELAKFANGFHSRTEPLEGIGIDPGLSGHWWNAARAGEGFMMEIAYAGSDLFLFVSFYAYDAEGNRTYLFAQGSADGTSLTVPVEIVIPAGAKWGDEFDPNDIPLPRPAWGTGTFTFGADCKTASFDFVANQDALDAGYTDIEGNLTRDLLTVGLKCPTFANNTQ